MTLDSTIKFSIVTPVYNREDCISRCIESVINQSYPFIELWIVDDGSSDNTVQIIESYLPKYSFINFHKFETNQGVNTARNYAIKRTTGDYIIFLDSDDQLENDITSFVSEVINKNKQYKYFMFATDDRINYYNKNIYLAEKETVLRFSDFLTGKVTGDFFHVINAELLKKYPFPEELRIYEGLNFLQLFKESSDLYFYKKIAVRRERERSDSVTSEYTLINKSSIRKKFIANSSQLKLFEEDYVTYDPKGEFVVPFISHTYLLGLASGNYELDFLDSLSKRWNQSVPVLYKLLRLFRMGSLVCLAITTYSRIKASVK